MCPEPRHARIFVFCCFPTDFPPYAQRIKQCEEALCAAKRALLQDRTIERLGAVKQAQVEQQQEVESLLLGTVGEAR